MKRYKALGIMSGTSLDGLDLAVCEFTKTNDHWNSKICIAETIAYSSSWKDKLSDGHLLSGYDLIKLDSDYGYYIGDLVKQFLSRNRTKVDFISSHGHTIFHNPGDSLTYQIGNGAAIAAASSITTVSNFRALDVALKGQGAPLVPIGDVYLFSDYDYCLNLGGFANVSYNWYKKRVAYDICPVNIVINSLSKELDLEFDKDGDEARKGKVNDVLFKSLNKLAFYHQEPPKSLGREWVEKHFYPLIYNTQLSFHDKLRTVYEHVAFQLSKIFTGASSKKILITGGGAHNKFLVDLIKSRVNLKIILPDKEIIDYKEAMVFAFLGVLRMREENNCLSSVTGAKHDCIGGNIFKI
jgi:anhydro-N-acetylmuramic acid kinase